MICIVIPCHRVIRADGALCRYGGGLEEMAARPRARLEEVISES